VIYVGEIEKKTKGYTQAGLNLLMSAYAEKLPVQLFPLMSPVRWDEQPHWAEPLREWMGQQGVARDVALLHHNPSSMPHMPHPGEQKNVAVTVIEADTLPKWIVESLSGSVDAVIVPSHFNKRIFERCGVSVPVHVLPHACGSWWWQDPFTEQRRSPGYEDSYVFYYIGTYNQRKNPEGALRAFLRAFPEPSPDQIFALKTMPTASLPIHEAMEGRTAVPTAERVAKVLEEETGTTERPDVWLWTGEWHESQMRWLHWMGDCNVSLHRGEGFGLVPLQAKLLGKPVIYTDWSSVPEFCTPSDGDEPIGYDLVPIRGMEAYPHFLPSEGEVLQWADPKLDVAMETMQEVVKMRATSWLVGDELAAFRERFSWHALGTEFGRIIEEIRGS